MPGVGPDGERSDFELVELKELVLSWIGRFSGVASAWRARGNGRCEGGKRLPGNDSGYKRVYGY